MNQQALAPIKWEMGQPLLPSHLTTQEDFLIADSALRTQSQSLPQYGISQLTWDEALLKKGNVSLTSLRLTIPSAQRIVDYPDNTHLLSSHIELSELAEPTIYYFILEENNRKQAEAQLHPSSNGKITRRYFKLILSHIRRLPEEFDDLLNDHNIQYQGRLAIFKRRALGDWHVTDTFIPPLVHLGTSPFLLAELSQVKRKLEHYKENLYASFQSEPLPIKQYVGLNGCIKSVQETLFMLENLSNLDNSQGEVTFHPYQIYQQLYRLCTELALYQGSWPDAATPYKHEEIHLIFGQLFSRLKSYLTQTSVSGRSTQFQLDKNIYSAKVPDNTSPEDELYFIIKLKNKAKLNPYEIPKLSSPSQLSHLFEYSLKGLSLKEVSETTINYNFGQSVQCFLIQKDQESDSVYHEASVAFYEQDAYEDYDFYLYTQSHRQVTE